MKKTGKSIWSAAVIFLSVWFSVLWQAKVLALIEKPFEGDDEYGDDMGNKVMAITNPENCIGCEACARVCIKKSQAHKER
jgi:NAD-dependent dihydropyrimidine dehydrogenase PreA subunit